MLNVNFKNLMKLYIQFNCNCNSKLFIIEILSLYTTSDAQLLHFLARHDTCRKIRLATPTPTPTSCRHELYFFLINNNNKIF